MNALPVGPERVADANARTRYFDDLERWGFDIAYNAFYAHSYDDVVGKLRSAYADFAAEAQRRGFPACIQIQSTVCAGDRVGIEEAQYNINNEPERWGERGFFGSFASTAFRDYLKEITDIFIKEYKYDCVVFEEPMYRVDVPGTQDRFYALFKERYPDVKYPEMPRETPEYLRVQQAKSEVLLDFYSDLVAHAKEAGAKKVGIMPWFFIPTIENTPPNTLNTSCNIGEIAQIPGLDLLVARMQPDNIYVNTMRTGDELQTSPVLYYFEVMAHSMGKDLITVTNPTDEYTDYPACPLIPEDFYKNSVTSAVAAAPGGFTRHWYGQNYGKDDAHMSVLTEAMECASRLGQPGSPVAFVFSYSGTRHFEPYTYETVFPFYWEFAKQMAFAAHRPMLTFYAGTLEQNLAQHPEVQVLVLDEHFPLAVDEMMAISRWWQSNAKRAVVAFGSGLGYVADHNFAGQQPCGGSYPGVFELIGLRQEENPQLALDEPVRLKDVSRIRRSAFLEGMEPLEVSKIANVRRIFGSRASVLYEVDVHDTKIPVVAEWRDRSTLALFCGFGLSRHTAEAAVRAVNYALKEVDSPPALIGSCSEGVLWNVNKNGYVVISNTADKPGSAVGRPGRANFWSCDSRQLLPDGDQVFEIPPNSFRIYRVVGRRSKFFDVHGASYLRNLIDGAGRAEIDIWAGKKTVLVLRASPREIVVDGKPSTVTQEVKDGVYYVTLQQCPPGERKISLKW